MSQEAIRIRELEASLEAHRLLLATISTRAEEAREQLFRVGQELGGEEFEDCLAALGDPENIPAAELASQVLSVVRNRKLSPHPDTVEGQVAELRRQAEDLKWQLDVQTKRASAAENSGQDLKKQVETLEKNLSIERSRNKELAAQVPPPETPAPPVDYSEWFTEWSRHKSFEQNKKIIVFLGATGLSRQVEIKEKLPKETGMKERTVYGHIEDCVVASLIERRDGTSPLGRPTDILLLTEKGQWTYTRLTGRTAVPSEYIGLLKAHKSNRQTSLILKVGDHFERLGYAVQREPTTINVAGGNHIFQPDLIVQKDGETFYLEVETGEQLERSSLAQKWQNAMTVGGGRICVVAPRSSVMTTLQSHILDWGTERGRKPSLYLTNLEWLRNCMPGDSPWARNR
jgi:hypothetical protein